MIRRTEWRKPNKFYKDEEVGQESIQRDQLKNLLFKAYSSMPTTQGVSVVYELIGE